MSHPSNASLERRSTDECGNARRDPSKRARAGMSGARFPAIAGMLALFIGQSLVASSALAQAAFCRLQLKHDGQFLDADRCSNKICLNPGSDWEGGACQLWRLVPAGG